MTDDPSDRRRQPRAPIQLKIEYKRMNTFFHDYTKNISKGGLFIKTDKPLEVGTEFLFRLMVPALPDPIGIKGEVRWVIDEEDATGHDPGMGIQFVYDSDADRDGMERQVEKLMVDSLGQLIYSRLMGNEG